MSAKCPPPMPSFMTNAAQELADEELKSLSLLEHGLRHQMRLYCWANESVPEHPDGLSRLLGLPKAEVEAAFTEALRERFTTLPDAPGRLIDPELEVQRQNLAQRKARQSAGGKEGADRYWSGQRRQASMGNPIGNQTGSAMGTPSLRKEVKEENKRREETPHSENAGNPKTQSASRESTTDKNRDYSAEVQKQAIEKMKEQLVVKTAFPMDPES